MNDLKYQLPKVPESFKIGNRGEAFLEFIMSKHCLMHKIAGYKDIGIDYICEWLVEDSPTRILFGIQVKTSDKNDVKLEDLGRHKGMNGLQKFKFASNIPSWEIKETTVNYWFGFDIPLYLFFVVKNNSNFDCYYQRLTPKLHKNDKKKARQEIQNYKKNEIYKANDGSEFRAIIDRGKQDEGFARDLFFDSVRCAYYSGSLKYKAGSEFGLKGWDKDTTYVTILGEEECPYIDRVEESLDKLKSQGVISVLPTWGEEIRRMKAKLSKK